MMPAELDQRTRTGDRVTYAVNPYGEADYAEEAGGSPSGTFAATLPAVTASFSGTYRDVGTFAATIPVLVASFAGTYAAPPTGTLTATLPTTTADFAGSYTPPVDPTGDFAAVLPVVTASFSGDYFPHESGTFGAVLPLTAAAFDGTYTPPPISGSFAATLPLLTASFEGEGGSALGSFEAILPLVTAHFSGSYGGPYPTDTSNSANGIDVIVTGIVTRVSPVAEPPVSLGTRVDKALAYPTPTMVDGRPT